MKTPNVVATVDTASIGPNKNAIGLKKLCQAMNMEPHSLHNAGNDAAYTLRALILAVCPYVLNGAGTFRLHRSSWHPLADLVEFCC